MRAIAPPSADPALTRWLARQIVRQHTEKPERIDEGAIPLRQLDIASRASGCAQCGDGNDPTCWMLGWARAELAQKPGDPRRDLGR
ncbi:hypothetical protein RB614_37825 [Phytohabitans sp. ZYX-F-186]|uniref:4Fe-4S Wbl-type domain-containing protein n=1 Tax=Phytohabitans maris TaxID=3071409 RepID=A0ABU0ZVB3_9ACTN|nr:hypothetical protein [Phytohabitans sp. ZYX-F-186]MDQ7910269.1 hypothetical protein [Phytohabitans sp. ZYX-F-186]